MLLPPYLDVKVVGIVFAEEELEVVTGGADGTFLVWQMPSLVLKQRFARSNASPLVRHQLQYPNSEHHQQERNTK